MTYDTLPHLSDPAIWLALASLTVAAGAQTATALAWVRLWREGRTTRKDTPDADT